MADKLLTDPLSAAPVPAYLSDVEAACLPTAGLTAWRALVTDGNVRPGDVVLVQGTGGVAQGCPIKFFGSRWCAGSGYPNRLSCAGP